MKKALLVLLFLIIVTGLSGCGNHAKTPNSAEDYIGVNYETAQAELKKAGFTNIETRDVEDLTSSGELQDGDVGEISINGNSSFDKKAEFAKDAQIIITYHTIKKLQAPMSSSEIQGLDYTAVAALFTDAGFENVTTEEVYDLDPELTNVEFENEISIDWTSSFEKGEIFPFDSKISVICHRPYEKHTVRIHINFIPNLIFSKYDVVFSVDDDEYTLAHGESGDYEFSLKDGTYAISFESAESSSVKGEAAIDVDCDIEASFKISCSSDRVTVEEEYLDRKEALAENEVKILSDKYEFTMEDYKDVIKTLQDLGFTNIQEKPLYDIVLGWTDEGEVENVIINGTDDYRRGDVFKSDVEVIVSYHLKKEDDPNKVTASDEPNLTIENCEDLANLIHLDREKDENDIKSFVTNYTGRYIEVELLTAFVENYKDYDTRFNYLLYAVESENAMLSGPAFMFKNVNYYDLHLTGVNIPASFGVGIHCKVCAEVEGCEDGMILLDPKSIVVIQEY